jgi:hypothetical protein
VSGRVLGQGPSTTMSTRRPGRMGQALQFCAVHHLCGPKQSDRRASVVGRPRRVRGGQLKRDPFPGRTRAGSTTIDEGPNNQAAVSVASQRPTVTVTVLRGRGGNRSLVANCRGLHRVSAICIPEIMGCPLAGPPRPANGISIPSTAAMLAAQPSAAAVLLACVGRWGKGLRQTVEHAQRQRALYGSPLRSSGR